MNMVKNFGSYIYWTSATWILDLTSKGLQCNQEDQNTFYHKYLFKGSYECAWQSHLSISSLT